VSRPVVWIPFAVFVCAGIVYGQCNAVPQPAVTAGSPHFDVASVRLADGRSLIRRHSPGRIDYEGMTMAQLLLKAFDVPEYRIVWPDWIPHMGARPKNPDSRYYTIAATMPPTTTNDQFRAMLQNLLRERFGLREHRETKDLPVYGLVVASGGIRMRESPSRDATKVDPALSDSENVESIRRGETRHESFGEFGMRIQGDFTVADIAKSFMLWLPHPIEDCTGLNKYYDVDLSWSWNPYFEPPADGVANKAGDAYVKELFSVLEKKLGLTVQLRTVPTELIAIDHLDHVPTEN
jgi:uncharacterized protein (TIGR03435 family)